MAFISKLFGRREDETRKTTVDDPVRIAAPVIGFLNLDGARGGSLAQADMASLGPLFKGSHLSQNTIPRCHVLFVYCGIEPGGRITGSPSRLREIVKAAGALVAVVATENTPDRYFEAVEPRNDWHANLVLVIKRKGETFHSFFRQLFQSMLSGKSMLMTWVELAPQIPGGAHADCPESIMLAEAGHVTFDGRSERLSSG